jgi:protein TIF31
MAETISSEVYEVFEIVEEAEPPAPESELLTGLVILPPRQAAAAVSGGRSTLLPALALPPIRKEEPVQSLRQAISEVVGLAAITNYRLELEPTTTAPTESSSAVPIKTTPYEPQLVKEFTGRGAIVSIPSSIKGLNDNHHIGSKTSKVVLDDWGDLSALDLQDGSAFTMVLHRYDVSTVKDHIHRVRQLLQGGAPSVTSLVEPVNEKDVAPSQQAAQVSPDIVLPPYDMSSANLKDFFYLAMGENPSDYHGSSTNNINNKKSESSTTSKNKKKKKASVVENVPTTSITAATRNTLEQDMRHKIPRWNELEELCRIKNVEIRYSPGFHPPPQTRKWMGDLAYLEFEIVDSSEDIVHVTACRTGFYVNKCHGKKFDPAPAAKDCYSHSLLDCLLQASPSLQIQWSQALAASKERAGIMNEFNLLSPELSVFRLAVRGDFDGFSCSETAHSIMQQFDAAVQTPSWLVPLPNGAKKLAGWTRNEYHGYDSSRAEDDFSNTFGLDLRSGGIRDWNEEFQLAREMPTSTRQERIDRARLLYKVMGEYGEAALMGVKAIVEGQITPMNPNEAMRTQVYLHNNIFFSRAVDAGPETFKISKGDRAARKSANRDLQCNATFYRMEKSGFSTLATVLIDFLGTRFVCQSILPGILIGDRAHTILLGAVESCAPLKWDKELHKLLESRIGASMMLATRPVLCYPLTDERVQEIERLKKDLPMFPPQLALMHQVEEEKKNDLEPDAVINSCVPVEAKGILGSDQRTYLLDFGRLTPRDANWVSVDKGGTGKWENIMKSGAKTSSAIPMKLDDDEFTLCVLRPELVTRFIKAKVTKRYWESKEKESAQKKASDELKKQEGESDGKKMEELNVIDELKKQEGGSVGRKKLEPFEIEIAGEDVAYMDSLQMNVNVFLPDVRYVETDEAVSQLKQDEELVRELSNWLWDETLPLITKAIRDGVHASQIPSDGKSLTVFLHRHGVNCRYLGRLAALAQEQEAYDAKVDEDMKNNRLKMIERKTMPKCWLELLECEMVARAAKHVLDGYLTELGGGAAGQPAQTVASFLSATVSEMEETAAQTEARTEKRSSSEPDDDAFGALAISGVGGEGDAVPSRVRSRHEVWQDIEREIGRRFRYTLTLFNTGNTSGRARHAPLLRRVCQRSGVRLALKNYDVGDSCLCSGNAFGGRLACSYPISPVDVVDIVPLMKHAAAFGEGFYPCMVTPHVTLPPLHVSLQDAREALDRAHVQGANHALQNGLELAQEALFLYQRVTESPTHPGVSESIDLMSSIFCEGGDLPNAILHAEKALGILIQIEGFDTSGVISAHLSLFAMNWTAKNIRSCVKHLRAAIYLCELLCGPNHAEMGTMLHKLGSAYLQPSCKDKYLNDARKCFYEAVSRDNSERLMKGISLNSYAKSLASMGDYKEALEYQKKAYKIIAIFMGKENRMTTDCEQELLSFLKLATKKGDRGVDHTKLKEEAAKAEAIAADLLASEESEKKKSNKKKKGKK